MPTTPSRSASSHRSASGRASPRARRADEAAAPGRRGHWQCRRTLISFANRDRSVYYYPDRQWFASFAGPYDFIENGALNSDKRVMWFYNATGVTPAMSTPQVGTGSVYPCAVRDSKGNYLDGGKTYSVTLPAPIPANNFWAFTVYDGQTRSLLETDQRSAGVDSTNPKVKANDDGSYTVYFGPTAPEERTTTGSRLCPARATSCS